MKTDAPPGVEIPPLAFDGFGLWPGIFPAQFTNRNLRENGFVYRRFNHFCDGIIDPQTGVRDVGGRMKVLHLLHLLHLLRRLRCHERARTAARIGVIRSRGHPENGADQEPGHRGGDAEFENVQGCMVRH